MTDILIIPCNKSAQLLVAFLLYLQSQCEESAVRGGEGTGATVQQPRFHNAAEVMYFL